MATLTFSSALSVVVDQFLANANWFGNLSTAILRKEAIDWLLVCRPSYSVVRGRNVTFDYSILAAEKQAIDDFIESINTSLRPNMFTRGRVTGLGEL